MNETKHMEPRKLEAISLTQIQPKQTTPTTLWNALTYTYIQQQDTPQTGNGSKNRMNQSKNAYKI